MNLLSSDLLFEIFWWIPTENTITLALVCQRWRVLTNTENWNYWKNRALHREKLVAPFNQIVDAIENHLKTTDQPLFNYSKPEIWGSYLYFIPQYGPSYQKGGRLLGDPISISKLDFPKSLIFYFYLRMIFKGIERLSIWIFNMAFLCCLAIQKDNLALLKFYYSRLIKRNNPRKIFLEHRHSWLRLCDINLSKQCFLWLTTMDEFRRPNYGLERWNISLRFFLCFSKEEQSRLISLKRTHNRIGPDLKFISPIFLLMSRRYLKLGLAIFDQVPDEYRSTMATLIPQENLDLYPMSFKIVDLFCYCSVYYPDSDVCSLDFKIGSDLLLQCSDCQENIGTVHQMWRHYLTHPFKNLELNVDFQVPIYCCILQKFYRVDELNQHVVDHLTYRLIYELLKQVPQ